MKKEVTKKQAQEFQKQSYKIKVYNWARLISLIYLFVFAIELIKKASFSLAPKINALLLMNLSPIKSVSIGWLTTSFVQSSGAVGSIVATFAGENLINLQTVVYILVGASIGTTITALIISLITYSKKKRDFRHGFEIGLACSIYGIFLAAIVLSLEYFFKFFSKISLIVATKIHGEISILRIPNLIETITDSVINLFFEDSSKILILALGFIILIFTLRFLGKSIIALLGGEQKTRNKINKYFHSKYKTYLIGFLLTAVVFSSSITIGLLVPLAVSRLINLKKAIPFILGASLGTFSDLFLISIIIGKVNAIATAVSFFMFALIGGIIFLPNSNLLFKITKYVSKKIMHISRKKVFLILLIFILTPLAIILLF